MQNTHSILLIRPSSFGFNKETAESNAFQLELEESEEVIKQKKLAEFDEFERILSAKGVNVFVFEDCVQTVKPDAIFPNNWISFHADGTIILYPMYASNRRSERRLDIISALRKDFIVTRILDLSSYETENKYLEGTGSIIFDHANKIAYACSSPRTNEDVFLVVCTTLNYQPIYFYAHDKGGKEIYHTNVLMCIAEHYAVICSASITNTEEKAVVIKSLQESGHKIVDISFTQMEKFAGNMLELCTNSKEHILALSQSAYDILSDLQREEIAAFSEFVPLSIPTIETIGGGSARCMIAEIFLPKVC